MKKFLYGLLLATTVVWMTVLPVLAATYYANIQVQETSSNAYTQLPVRLSVDNDYLADNGYIQADGLDTRVITGAGASLPHLVADDKLLFTLNVTADSTSNLQYTLNNTSLASMPIIVGYNGFINITDADALELGSNFTIEQKGYVDTSSGALLPRDEILRPDGEGTTTDIEDVFGEGTHWETVDEASADGDTTYVFDTGASSVDTYTATNVTQTDAPVSNVVVCAEGKVTANAGAGDTLRIVIRTGGSNYFSSPNNVLTTNYVNYSYTWATNPDTGVAWTLSDLDSLEIGVELAESGSDQARCTQVYATVNYDVPLLVYKESAFYTYVSATGNITSEVVGGTTVSATGVSSGEHTVKTTYDGADLTIIVDEGEASEKSDTDAWVGSVSDGGSSWALMQNNAMPYMEYYCHTVNSTLIAHYQPITIVSGTTLPDREGTAQNGIITWGSNPAGIDVTIGSLISYSQPVPSGVTADPTQDIVGGTSQPGWTDSTSALTTHPFYPLVWAVTTTTDFSASQVWLIGATFLVIAAMLLMFSWVPHQLITVVVGGALTGYFISMGIYPFWTIFCFIVLGIAVVLWERVPSV